MSGAAERVRAWARTALLWRANDVTQMSATRSALVIAPHPDDETLGCGARIALARHAAVPVTVVVATGGSASHAGSADEPDEILRVRRQELIAAGARLGLSEDHLVLLDYPDTQLAEHVDDLYDVIARIIADLRPSDVYVTCGQESHPDHAAASDAARRAVATAGGNVRLLEYPIWLWADWPLSRRFARGGGLLQLCRALFTGAMERVHVDDVRAVKQQALAEYSSQLGTAAIGRNRVSLSDAVVERALTGPELYFVVGGKALGRRA